MADIYRSTDALMRALDVMGDKWTLLLLRELRGDAQTYQALLDSTKGIPTNILAARLKRLVDTGLVEKTAYQDRPRRYRYSLTAQGAGLAPAIDALATWGQDALGGSAKVAAAAPSKRQNEWAFGPDDSVW